MKSITFERLIHVPSKWKHKGFTLVELMITMFVVGVLVIIAIPSFISYVQTTGLLEQQKIYITPCNTLEVRL